MGYKKLLYLAVSFVCLLLAVPTIAYADVQPNDNEVWWGYYKDSDGLLGFGSGQADHYDCAILVRGSDSQFKGHTIRAIRFVMQGTNAATNVKVWISKELPMRPEDASEGCIPLLSSMLKDNQPIEVLLPKSYTLPASDVYVGFSFTTTKAETMAQQFPVLTTDDGSYIDGSFYMRSDNGWPQWTALSNEGYGKLALQILIDGSYKRNAVRVSNFGDAITLKNDSVQVPVEFRNFGTNGVHDFDYTISTNGAVEFTRHIELDEPIVGYDVVSNVNLTLLADPALGCVDKQIVITKVNGEDNEEEQITSNGTLVTLEASAPHRAVYEEFTATWAPASPRGFAGKKLTKEKLGDDVIWISAHVGTDPMSISEYQSVYNNPGSGLAPSGLTNRMLIGDPYFGATQPRTGFALDKDLEPDLAKVSEASIEMSEPQMDKNGQIRYSTNVIFNYSREEAPYAVGYVLLADGLKGTGSNWEQANIFPGWVGSGYFDESDENLNIYASMPNPIPNLVFDDVAIAAYGITKGLPGTIKAPIVMGETQTINYTMELGANPLAQNLHQLRVVALLFNTNSGEIVNAVMRPVTVSEEFASNAATTENFGEILVIAGQQTTIPITIESTGKTDITAVDVEVSIAGQALKTENIAIEPALPFGNKKVIEVPITVPSDVKDYATKFTLTKINGVDNEGVVAKLTADGTLRAMSKAPLHKTFIEEFTGTWCGFCPRGTLGLKLSEERHPGKFVAVAVHGNDVMTINSYNPILVTVAGYPTSYVDRSFETDPYMGNQTKFYGLGAVIEEEAAKLTEASVALNPLYDENTNTVIVNSTTKFYINSDTAPYAIGYILVHDELEGMGSKWLQSNYYASYKESGQLSDDPDIQELIQADEKLDWPYNHVPIDTKGIERGIEGSLPAPLVAGQEKHHSVTFNLAGNSLVQDTSKLKVVALIFNTTTGRVVNAEEAHVGDYVGISDINATSTADVEQIFTIDGKRISRMQQGVNILRMSDGTVRKVIVE